MLLDICADRASVLNDDIENIVKLPTKVLATPINYHKYCRIT